MIISPAAAVLAMAHPEGKESVLIPEDVLPALRAEMAEQITGEPLTMHRVSVPPGKTILPHRHDEHVVMYYPEDSEVPVLIAGHKHLPKAGHMIVIPAGVYHSVPRNNTKKTRVSVALKIRPEEH